MSILIKGMELPKNCVECGVYWDGCPVWNLENIDKDYSEKRAPNCPLVPVPPHGGLIDADEYRDEFMNGVYALCNDDTDNYRANAIIDLFDNAPTVIEAEGPYNGNQTNAR